MMIVDKFKHQYGFKKGTSIEHVILDLYKNFVESIEKNAKVFDTVNHKIMWKRLEYYDVREVPLI